MTNLHVGEISEGESGVRSLKRNNTKNSHTGEIGEGESDVRLLKREERVYRITVYSTTGTTWSGSPLWRESAAMTALLYSTLHTRIYRGYVHVYWPRVRRYTQRITKRFSTRDYINILRHWGSTCGKGWDTTCWGFLQYCPSTFRFKKIFLKPFFIPSTSCPLCVSVFIKPSVFYRKRLTIIHIKTVPTSLIFYNSTILYVDHQVMPHVHGRTKHFGLPWAATCVCYPCSPVCYSSIFTRKIVF